MDNTAWTSTSLSEALGVNISLDIVANKVEFNSKDILPGDIFIGLPGANRDGNEFVEDAIAKGAAFAITNRTIHVAKNILYIEDTFKALQQLADYKRRNSNTKFVGITGSVGKTSTKEATASILSNFAHTFCNKGNFNNYIGVPLSLASLPIAAHFSVNELGMNSEGEIRSLVKQLKPHIAIITKIGEAHLEFFNSIEDICRAKCEIFEGLNNDGVAIVNRDCQFYAMQIKILKQLGIKEIYSFGENLQSDCFISEYKNLGDVSEVTYNILGKIYRTKNYLLGKHQSLNIASSLLAALALGVNMDQATSAVEAIRPYNGRGTEWSITLSNGNNIVIIDDAYNSNPLSLKAALSTISEKKGNKIAILADMKELGSEGSKIHAEMAGYVIKSGVSRLFTVGHLMQNLHNEVKNKLVQSFHYDEANEEIFEEIFEEIKKQEQDTVLLVKGSNSTGIRDIVSYIKRKHNI